MIGRREALQLVDSHLKSEKLKKHVIAVEAIMRGLADRLGGDPEIWGLTGLLHDLDYETTINNFEKHGIITAELIKDKVPVEIVDAIRAHNEYTGFKCESKLATALKIADQLSGLIVATALVMPSKSLEEVKIKSLKKKFKQKDFARSVRRDKILLCEKLGLSLEEVFKIGLESMLKVRRELGL